MTSVTVVVPYRGDNGGPRDQAWSCVERWWRDNYPDFQVVVGYLPDGPWCKARAVANALADAAYLGDVLVIADADVVASGVGRAVDLVAAGSWPWAVPHGRVHRLSPEVTSGVLAGGPLPLDPPLGRFDRGVVVESYRGLAGGGLVVLPRPLYERVPLDPRFEGWGQEDAAFGLALITTAGSAYRGADPLWHLWHPPQPRIKRAVGSAESMALYRRYRHAFQSPERMSELLAEVVHPTV